MKAYLQKAVLIGLLSLLSGVSSIQASEAEVNVEGDKELGPDRINQVLTFQVENDLFFGATDRDYTNGLRVSYAYEPLREGKGLDQKISGFLRGLTKRFGEAGNGENGHIYYTLGFGQNMFTPEDLSANAIVEDDRPYAGWTYLEFGTIAEDDKNFEAWKLDIGLVGPASGAGWTQRRWHELINSPRPEGWEFQLPNEPGVSLHYSRGRRFQIFGPNRKQKKLSSGGLQMDVMPHVTAALGNVFTHAAAGATIRLGTDLSRDVGAPPRIQPSMPGSEMFRGNGFDMYLFAGGEARYVARNIFLDGTWRSHPHSVSSKDFVADLQVGGVIMMGNWRLALTHVWRSHEYVGSKVKQEYGAVTMSYRF